MVSAQGRGMQVAWIVAAACGLCLIYLPTLTHPFDFCDDGCLVYPTPGLTPATWLQLVWDKTTEEFQYRGPFRPVTWAHWEGSANLLGANALAHRWYHLGLAVLSAGLFLWLLRELGIQAALALLTAAIAMWAPLRSEIWLGLGLTEAFGMPYALLALVCALRASRSSRPWRWDVFGLLAALGCKNTFAAIVPVQMFLRMAGSGLPWRQAWQLHGRTAFLLGLSLLLPIIHFLAYKLDGQPRTYVVTGFTVTQLKSMLWSVWKAAGIEYLGPGFVLLLLFLWFSRKHRELHGSAGASPSRHTNLSTALAGLGLVILGVGIYLPMSGVAGRYTIPAVWGVDLALAVLLQRIFDRPKSTFRTAGICALGLGLMAMLAANLGKQDKFVARSNLLWQALAHVELHSPEGAQVGFVYEKTPLPSQLALSEWAHFRWHLRARGREDVTVQPIEAQSGSASTDIRFALLAGEGPPPEPGWRLVRTFTSQYWLGSRSYQCSLWEFAADARASGRNGN